MRSGHSVKSKRVETAVMCLQHVSQSGAIHNPCAHDCRSRSGGVQLELVRQMAERLLGGNQASPYARPLTVWRFDSRWQLSQTTGKNFVRMLAGGVQNVAANAQMFSSHSAEEYSAKLLQRIATAIHSQRYRLQCYAHVHMYCNTRSRWQKSTFLHPERCAGVYLSRLRCLLGKVAGESAQSRM